MEAGKMIGATTGSEQGIPFVSVRGTARECGRQYGSAAAAAIHHTISAYFSAFLHHNSLDEAQVLQLAKSLLPVCSSYDETLVEEMRGIAEGAGVPLEAIIAINARSELVYGQRAREANDGCTSFAVFGSATQDGRMLIGQNWDWKPSLRESTIALRIEREDDPAVLTITEAGLLAKFGFNASGVGSVVNFMLADARRFGTPVHLIRRKLLRARSFDEAAAAIESTRRALSANYLLAYIDGPVVDFETTPYGSVAIEPSKDIITHANHFQIPTETLRDLGREIFPDSCSRDIRLRLLLEEHHGRITVDTCKIALRDHENHPTSICRHPDPLQKPDDQIETLGSIIIDLTNQEMHFAAGPPCRGHFQLLRLQP